MRKNKFWKSILVYFLCILVFLCFASCNSVKINNEQTDDSGSISKNINTLVAISNQNDLEKPKTSEVDIEEDTSVIWDNLSEQDKCSYEERILLLVLNPYIQEAITNYYGEKRQYDNAEIIYIIPKKLNHLIQIRVSTFVGPHNPPYGEDTITLEINSSKIQLIDFQHINIDEGAATKSEF